MYPVVYFVKTLLLSIYISYTNSKILGIKPINKIIILIKIFIYLLLSSIYAYINVKIGMDINNAVFTTITVMMVYAILDKIELAY